MAKSIQNLESELDVPLLTRGPRGVAPTIYGDILLKHAKLLRNQGEQAVAEIRALKDGHAGHLRLGVGMATCCAPRPSRSRRTCRMSIARNPLVLDITKRNWDMQIKSWTRIPGGSMLQADDSDHG